MTKLRVPVYAGIGGLFNPTEPEWARVEDAYGRQLPRAVREEISAIFVRFIEQTNLERSARTTDEGARALDRARRSAFRLVSDLKQLEQEDLIEQAVRALCESQVLRRGQELEDFKGLLWAFIGACDDTIIQVEQLVEHGSAIRPGTAWDNMVI